VVFSEYFSIFQYTSDGDEQMLKRTAAAVSLVIFAGIGSDRIGSGSNAVGQYHHPLAEQFDALENAGGKSRRTPMGGRQGKIGSAGGKRPAMAG
jgi:hypothetical protein